MPDSDQKNLVLARIGRPHGLKGEVTVQVHTDRPDQHFTSGAEFPTRDGGGVGSLRVRSVRVHQGVYLLGFDGIDDRTGAEGLRGTVLVTPIAPGSNTEDMENTEDTEEGWYEADLLGFTVVRTDRTRVGLVSALHTRPVQDLLEVALDTGGHALVPFVEEIVPEVDEGRREVVIDPPGGLLDLGAAGG